MPFIDGYKPARNYQVELKRAVLARLQGSRRFAETLASYGTAPRSAEPEILRLRDVIVEPPRGRASSKTDRGLQLTQGEWGALRDSQLRAIGEAGERWVVGLERAELTATGRPDLAERVEWTSKVRGDGLGFDVSSFETGGRPIQIEVKTTNLGPRSPFYITRNELSTSERFAATYRLYRVFDFAQRPKMFVAEGSVASSFSLDPMIFAARPA